MIRVNAYMFIMSTLNNARLVYLIIHNTYMRVSVHAYMSIVYNSVFKLKFP